MEIGQNLEILWRGTRTSNTGADDDERQALWAKGLDPDDPAVIKAIDVATGVSLAAESLC